MESEMAQDHDTHEILRLEGLLSLPVLSALRHPHIHFSKGGLVRSPPGPPTSAPQKKPFLSPYMCSNSVIPYDPSLVRRQYGKRFMNLISTNLTVKKY